MLARRTTSRNRNQSHQHTTIPTDKPNMLRPPAKPIQTDPNRTERNRNQSNPINGCNFLLIVNIFNDGIRQSKTPPHPHMTTGLGHGLGLGSRTRTRTRTPNVAPSSINFNRTVGGSSAGSSGSNASNVGSTTAGTATGSNTSTAVAAAVSATDRDAHQFAAAAAPAATSSAVGLVGSISKWSPNGNVSNPALYYVWAIFIPSTTFFIGFVQFQLSIALISPLRCKFRKGLLQRENINL